MPHSRTTSTAPLAAVTLVPTPHCKVEMSLSSQACFASARITFACVVSRTTSSCVTLVENAACFCCAFVRFAKAVLTAALFFLVGFLAALAFADFNAFSAEATALSALA